MKIRTHKEITIKEINKLIENNKNLSRDNEHLSFQLKAAKQAFYKLLNAKNDDQIKIAIKQLRELNYITK